MSALAVVDIGRLYTMDQRAGGTLGVVENAVVHSKDGVITYAGPVQGAPPLPANAKVLHAHGLAVVPGLVDCHTHALWAGSRVSEFSMRARGASYADILQAGGGIVSTMRYVREASEGDLVAGLHRRLEPMIARGVTTVEVKSGYGLSVEAELKCLHAIARAAEASPIEITPTFLGAHAVPPEFAGDSARYARLVADEMLPLVAAEKLAPHCDIFVERGAFTVDDGRVVLGKAKELGMRVRVHAEQLSRSGGAALAVEMGALSAGHLEHVSDDDILALSEAGVVAEVLSAAQVFLGMEQRIPGRKLADAGVPIAVATDLNPGSANVNDLCLAAGLAVTMCGLTVDEALLGITRNAARALVRSDIGRVMAGARADLVMLDTLNAHDLVYEWGTNHVDKVIARGVVL